MTRRKNDPHAVRIGMIVAALTLVGGCARTESAQTAPVSSASTVGESVVNGTTPSSAAATVDTSVRSTALTQTLVPTTKGASALANTEPETVVRSASWPKGTNIWQLHGEPYIRGNEADPATSLAELGERSEVVVLARLISVDRAADQGSPGPGAVPIDLFTVESLQDSGKQYQFELTRAEMEYDASIESIRSTIPRDESYVIFLKKRTDRPELMKCAVRLPCVTLVDPIEGADSVLAPGIVRDRLGGSQFTSVESFLKAVGGLKQLK